MTGDTVFNFGPQNNHEEASGGIGLMGMSLNCETSFETDIQRAIAPPNNALEPCVTEHPESAGRVSAGHSLQPEDYLTQEDDWFAPGRFFGIWAPDEIEIHKKDFVLLDSKNKQGTAVLVEHLSPERIKSLKRIRTPIGRICNYALVSIPIIRLPIKSQYRHNLMRGDR